MSGIAAAHSRIETISARFTPSHQTAGLQIELNEFDPFGEVYEQAVATAGPPVPGASGTAQVSGGDGSYATLLPPSYFAINARRTGWAPIESVDAAIHGVASTGGTRPVGGYGRMPVPEELSVYGNGRVPKERLQPIAQSGHRLFQPAAVAWDQLVQAAADEGHELKITDSYRPYENQVDLAARKGLYANGGLAAKPGTSNHGWGLAVDADVRDPALYEWLQQNGPRFGWVEAVPREPWHWEFRPHQV